ncbi:hypothetical protein SAMN05421749_103268 [Acinetobacter marinus]|uniref:Uncharacterized protein n=1 Tax=Acinetobacter marinus TaxID=281375 RepID=A0A1G6J7I8_9GAMM|nr:hypothetical protein SAMN05421749_103268 [Acinetobacter marinus]
MEALFFYGMLIYIDDITIKTLHDRQSATQLTIGSANTI